MARTAVFFRTHLWDEHVAAAAELLRARSAGADFRVLADESRHDLPVPPDLKLSHAAAEFDEMGLEPADHSLWFNGDYPLYKALRTFPDNDFYVMAEFDVRTTVQLGGMADEAAARGIDLIASRIEPASPAWSHRGTCAGSYETIYSALIPLVLVSRRLLEHLLERRLELSARLRRGEIARWPYCEAFIPSETVADGRFRWAELSEFGDVQRFDWAPAMPEHVMTRVTGPAFLHPVLDDERFVRSRLRTEDPFSFCDPGSPAGAWVRGCDPSVVLAVLVPIYRRARNYMAVSRLRRLLGLPSLAHATASIAFAKPATQSSVSAYSFGGAPERDAAGGNDGLPTGEFGFHTGTEDDPWWMVDLLRPFALERVRLLNRPGLEGRARRFSVLASLDGHAWTTVLRRDDGADFGGVGGAPFEAALDGAAPARFVKVQLHGRTCMHLDQVELFGSPVPAV